MLPDQVLSTETIYAQFLFPRNIPRAQLIDYEYGGVDIADGTRGLRVKVWKGEYIEDQILLTADGVSPVVLLSLPDVVEFGFSFDRNMNTFVTYELANGNCFFRWFDSLTSDYVTTQLPSGSRAPRCAHDDTRDLETATSDIILAYLRGGTLYFRAQRDRYEVEYTLQTGFETARLLQVGLNRALRFQFQLSSIPSGLDSPGVT